MIFDDWKEHKNNNLSPTLLWEYDLKKIDWESMKVLVVQRVIERGWIDDYYAAIRMYGGMENFKNIIKQIPILTNKEISFVCKIFNLKKEELKCYTRKQLREKLLNS